MARKLAQLDSVVRKYKQGAVVMIELPTDSYIDAGLSVVASLVEKGFSGIYVSFQRPFRSVSALLDREGVSMDRLLFVDMAALFGGQPVAKDSRCIHIGEAMEVDELVVAIYRSLDTLDSEHRFIFIDSLTTMTLYKPLSELLRLSEFLIHTVRKEQSEQTLLVFNVAKDLSSKKFIKDIALHVDKVIALAP